MNEFNELDFNFDNTPDIVLPPTAGTRELRFDNVAKIERQKDVRLKDEVEYPTLVVVGSINDGGKGTFPAEEQNRQVFLRYNLSNQTDQIQAKRMFLAAGIDTQGRSTGELCEALKGRTARCDFRHKNADRDGLPVVYGNVRDWIVAAEMIHNAPGKTPVVPTVA